MIEIKGHPLPHIWTINSLLVDTDIVVNQRLPHLVGISIARNLTVVSRAELIKAIWPEGVSVLSDILKDSCDMSKTDDLSREHKSAAQKALAMLEVN